MKTPIIIIYVTFDLDTRVGVKTVKYSTCTWYLYLSTYLSVLDVLEYLVYGNAKVLVLVQVNSDLTKKYYLLKSVKELII